MKRRSIWILAGIVVLAAWVGWMLQGEEVIELHNATCPVSGRPVRGDHSYTYQNKRYRLCQPECAVPFSQDPERYANQKPNSCACPQKDDS